MPDSPSREHRPELLRVDVEVDRRTRDDGRAAEDGLAVSVLQGAEKATEIAGVIDEGEDGEGGAEKFAEREGDGEELEREEGETGELRLSDGERTRTGGRTDGELDGRLGCTRNREG